VKLYNGHGTGEQFYLISPLHNAPSTNTASIQPFHSTQTTSNTCGIGCICKFGKGSLSNIIDSWYVFDPNSIV